MRAQVCFWPVFVRSEKTIKRYERPRLNIKIVYKKLMKSSMNSGAFLLSHCVCVMLKCNRQTPSRYVEEERVMKREMNRKQEVVLSSAVQPVARI